MSRFKDFKCFGGWLTLQWKPSVLVWWSNDATPPNKTNNGRWIVGSWHKWASGENV